MYIAWKFLKDSATKLFSGNRLPPGVLELRRYFAVYKEINFVKEVQPDGTIVAVSTDFHQGGIVTSGKDEEQLKENIEDAILTAFDVPGVYAKEAGIRQVGKHKLRYAPAQRTA